MRKLTEKEKAELQAKIADERSQKNRKEQRLISYKHQYKRYSGSGNATGGYFKMSGVGGGQSYTSRFRAAKREKAFNHVFAKGEPLRTMKLTEEQKQALKLKLAETSEQ